MADTQFLALLQQEEASIKALLPTWITPDRWWALMVEVAKSKDLQRIAQSNPASLIAAVKKLADWGLELDGEEAIILPYGEEAVPQAMYRGLIRRAVDAGAIAHVVADVIKDGDVVEITSGTDGRKLTHRVAFGMKGKRAILGAYAIVTLPNGTTDYELFESDDIQKVKDAALRMARRRKADAGLSPAWQQFEGEMVKKSVLRRALKRFRGKRDTDAGRRFNAAAEGVSFDAEVEGKELPPDNLPPDNSGTVRKLMPDEAAGTDTHGRASGPVSAALLISDADIDELGKQWRSLHNGRMTGASEWLLRTFKVEDFAELTADKVAQCAQLMAEAV